MTQPNNIGKKLNQDGTFRKYAGNTTLCLLNDCPEVMQTILGIRSRIQEMPYANRFSFLPTGSLHMTVFELLCDEVRDDEHWTPYIPKNINIRDTDYFFCRCFYILKRPHHLLMKPTSFYCNDVLIVKLRPYDEYSRTALRRYRNEFSNISGIRFLNHDTYEFHITLAYMYNNLSDQEHESVVAYLNKVFSEQNFQNKILRMPSPTVAKFDDMTAFYPICI